MESFAKRALRPLAALLVLASVVLAGPVQPVSAAYRNFGAPRFSETEPGDIIMAANTLLTCPASTSCTDAQNGTGTPRANNDYNMIRIDIDDALGLDPTDATNISSAATLDLPATGTVRFAGLYWGAVSASDADRPDVKFATPASGGYLDLVATDIDDAGGGDTYQSFLDVTTLVQAGGAGQYVVGGIEAREGSGRHAGWSLVVVYGDNTEPYRNLSVFDGFQRVRDGEPINITVSGFVTPPTGPVTGQIGFVVYEGDDRYSGDFAQLNGIQLNDAVNPATNFFNSRISDGGVNVTTKNPNYVDQLGFDATITNTVGVIPPGSTSATITMDSNGDWYYPGVVTAAIDVYVPNLVLDLSKAVTDDNGGEVNPGDELTYDITFSNQGDDAGLVVVLTDQIPTNTTFLPGSLEIVAGDNTGVKTDATGDDTAHYDSVSNSVIFHLGTGATAATGGRVAPFATTGVAYHARFKVTVDPNTETLDAVNIAVLGYNGETIGDFYTSPTNQTVSPIVALADVKLTGKSDSTDPVLAGGALTWTIEAANDGPSVADNVTISDVLPAGLAFDPGGTDPRCTLGGSTVTCVLGAMTAGSTDSVTIAVDVSPTMSGGTFTNTAQISTTTTDLSTADDFATEQTTVNRLVDLEVTKTETPNPLIPPDSAVSGGQVDYLVTVTNNGPASATNVALTDLLPAGTSVAGTTSTGTCSVAAGTIDCTWPTLAVGASVTLAVTLDLAPGTATGTVLTNSASAASDEVEDPAGLPHAASVDTPVVRSADLALAKSATGPAIAGSTMTWNLDVTNAGPSHAENVTVVDTLPGGATFDPALSSSGCSEAGGIVTCTIPQVDAGANTSFAIGVQLDAGLAEGASLNNSATTSSDEADPNAGNNTAADTATVTRSSDLSILKSGPGTINAGGQITYTLAIANAGPSEASNIVAADTLPVGVTLNNAPGCTGTAVLSCAIASLGVGATASFTIVVDVPGAIADGIDLINDSSISADESDPNGADNTSQVTTTTDRTTTVELTKSESAGITDPVLAGTPISWDLILTNLSGSTDTNVIVTDDLTGLGVIGPVTANLTGVGGTCSVVDLLVSCSVPVLVGGATGQIVIAATADPAAVSGQVITNTASADGDFSVPTSAVEQTTINAEADLTLTKTGPSDLVAGQSGTWNIVATNTGAAQAGTVVIADLLPTGAAFQSYVSTPPTAICVPVGANVSCTVGDLAAGGVVSIDITAIVDRTSAAGTYANNASVTSTTTDPDPASNTASVTTNVTRSAEVGLLKTATTPNTTAGNTVSFALTTTNAGPTMATGVVLTDTVPAGFVFNAGLSDAACSAAGSIITCNLGDVDPLDPPVTVTLTFDVDPGQAPGVYTNSASVVAVEADPDATNNTDTADFTVDAIADVSIAKGSPATPAIPGETYSYTINVANAGPSVALATSVNDTLPPGTSMTTGSSVVCTESPAGTVSCLVGDLAPGASQTLTIVVAIDPAATGSLTNTASVSSATVDPDSSNNSGTDVTPLIPSADLALTKSAPATVNAGANLTWNLVASNAGPSLASSPTITDTLPAGLTFHPSSDPACSAVGSAVTCNLADIAPGGSISLAIVGSIAPSAIEGSLLTNSANLSSPVSDPDTTNNSDSVGSRVERSANLALTKVALPGVPVAGGNVSYLITLINNGPSTASAVSTTDTFVAALTPVSATPVGLGTCSISGQLVSCSASELLPGQSLQATIVGQIDPAANIGDVIVNNASSSGAESDPDPSDNTAQESVTVTRVADLGVLKTAGAPSGIAGELVTWDVTATNYGPSLATSIEVSDPLSAAMTFDPAGSSPGCTLTGSTVTCAAASLTSGASVTFIISATLNPSLADGATVNNTAAVNSVEGDPNPANDTSLASMTVTRSADLSINKTSPTTPPEPGATVVWGIAVSNTGPSDAATAVVTDTLPAGSTFNAAGSSPGCSLSGPGVVQCPIGTVAAGATTNIIVAADVDPSSTGAITNGAAISSATVDPVAINDTDSITDVLVPSADLVVTKTPVTGPVVAGQNVEWLIQVTNNGPSDAVNVLVSDSPGAQLSYLDAPSDSRCDLVGLDIECPLGTLAAGASDSVTVITALDTNVASGDVVSNVALATSDTADPDSGNSTDTADVTVTRLADLAITKTASTPSTHAGDVTIWTIQVNNLGPSDASGIVVSDALPSGATFDPASSTPGCTESGGIVSCPAPDLNDGASTSLNIAMTLASGLADGATISNTASVAGAEPDPSSANDTSTSAVAVTREADLAVVKHTPATPPVPGVVTSWVIDVTNNGPSDAQAVLVTDTLPAGVTFDAAGSDVGCTESTPGTVNCNIALITSGSTASVTIAALVSSDQTTAITNLADASATEADPNSSNNSDDAITSVIPRADLETLKTLVTSPVVAGELVVWTIQVTNNGPSDAVNVVTSDAFASAMTFNAAASDPACSPVGVMATCNHGTIAAGDSSTLTIAFDLSAAAFNGSNLINTATASSPTADPDSSNDTSTASGIVTQESDLAIAKVAGSPTATAGETASFTVSISNAGPSNASNVLVTDTVPAGTSFDPVGSDPSCTLIGSTITCSAPALTAGASTDFIISLNIDEDFADASALTNSATVSADQADPDSGNDTSSDSTAVSRSSDLSLVKSLPSPAPVSGSSTTWDLTVNNAGPSTASSVTVSDTLPAGTIFDAATSSPGCVETSPGSIDCALSNLSAGAVGSVTIGVTIDSSLTGSLDNSASVAAAEADPDGTNNSATSTAPLTTSADLAINKTLDTSPVVAGGQVSWTVTVTNNGPSDATAVQITDLPSSSSTFVPGASDPSCAQGAQLICAAGTIAAGSSQSFVITFNLDDVAAEGSTLSNTSQATSATSDPDPSNNDSSASGPVTTSADLALAKLALTPNTIAGETSTWELSVSNPGPSVSTNVVVTDVVPPGATFNPAGSDSGCSLVGSVVECSFGTLPTGSTTTANIAFDLDASLAAGSTVTNSATVGADTADSNSTNNTASQAVNVDRTADLTLSKSHNGASAIPGQVTTWDLIATNTGPSDASTVVITDTLAPDLTFDAASSDPACSETAPGVVTCSVGALAAGGSATVTIGTLVASAASGAIANNAVVSAAESDPVAASNLASATAPTAPSADLEISKSLNTTPVVAGDQVSWTVTVTNNGPSDAVNISVTEFADPRTAFAPGASDPACSLTATLTCSSASLAPGASQAFTVTFDLDPDSIDGSSINNTATVVSDTADPDATNDLASVDGVVTTTADLSLAKFPLTPNTTAGETAVWELSVNNPGPSTATNVVITDSIPPNTTFNAGASDPACVLAGAIVECSFASVPAGVTTTASVAFTLDPSVADSATVTNAASVVADTSDLSAANNSASSDVSADRSSDLALVKVHSGSTAIPGSGTTWDLTVTNLGSSDASGIVISDTVPAGTTFDAPTSDPGCSETSPGIVDCLVGDLAAGAATALTVGVNIDSSTTGTLINSAIVGANESDPNPANNVAVAIAAAEPESDLEIIKSVVTAPAVAGQPISWLITANNIGPSDASLVQITDTFPSALTFDAGASDPRCSDAGPGTVTCDLATLAGGSSANFTIVLDSASTIIDGASLTNTATITSASTDPDLSNNSTDATAPITRSSDLVVTKSGPASAVAGDVVSYDLTLTNSGPSEAANAVLTDTLPVEIVATAVAGHPSCVLVANTVTCSLATLAPGASIAATVTGTVSSSTVDSSALVNAASASSDSPDPDNSNDSASVSTTITREVDLELTKTLLGAIVAGREVLWELSVTNSGLSDASGVVITDTLPAGLTFRPDLSTAGCIAGVSCPVGVVPAGQTITVVVGSDAAPGLTLGDVLVNVASVTGNETELDPSSNNSSASGSVVRETDLSIIKQGPAAPITAGTAFVWTLDLANAGPSDGSGIVAIDALPAGTSFDAATSDPRCSAVGLSVTCTIGILTVGGTDTVAVGVNVSSGVSDGAMLTNSATVSADQGDPDNTNNSSSHTVDIARTSGLTATKVDVADPVVAGGQIGWEITVSNPTGPSDTDNVVLVDTLPPGVVYDAAASSPGCVEAPVGIVTCSAGTVAVGATAIFTLIADIDSSLAEGQLLTNEATVSGDGAAAVTTTEETTVTRAIDLSVTKTVSVAQVTPGVPLTYEITLSNAGPSDASSVSVIDALPAGSVVDGVTPGTDCVATLGTVTCLIPTLAAGASQVITIDITPEPWLGDGSNFDNTAVASAPETDVDSTNDSGSADVLADRIVDVSITKTASDSNADTGDSVTFDIVATNAGPSNADNSVVTDVLPAGVTFNPGLTTPGCTFVAGTVTCAITTIPAGSSSTITIGVDINAATIGTLTNTASIATAETNTNPDPTATEDVVVSELADLVLTKTADAVGTAGETMSFTFDVTNNGPGVARNVSVEDLLPAGLSVTASPAGCSDAAGTITCSMGDLAVGESASVTIQVVITADATMNIANTAVAASDASELVPGDNVASSNTVIERQADLAISKSAVSLDPVAGGQVTWLIEVVNQGPSSATNLEVTDVLPADLTFVSNGSSAACTDTDGTVTCVVADLMPTETATLTLVTQVEPTAFGLLTNTASVAGLETDPSPTTATADATVDVRRPAAELAITKQGSKSPLKNGDVATWTITVSNFGPEAILTPITVSDALPGGHILHSTVPDAPACIETSGTIDCALDGLAAGQSIELRIKTRTQVDQKSVSNTASATASGLQGGTDPDGTVTVAATAEITATPALAYTGSPLQLLLITSGILLLTGFFFLIVAKRRDDEEDQPVATSAG